MLKMLPSVLLLLVMFNANAFADIRVTYTDSSPTDHFVIKNVSGCLLNKGKVTIDFSTSIGRLVFDIDRNGWGYGFGEDNYLGGTYQPLTIVSGEQFVKQMTEVKDGDNRFELEFVNFEHGDTIAFNVDVDDTAGLMHPSVSGLEIEGASINVITPSIESDGAFDANAVAETDRTTCMS